MNEKPLGIVLIALYGAMMGVAGGFFALTSMIMSISGEVSSVEQLFFSIVVGAVSLGILASVYGLWFRQRWAKKITFWSYGASIPMTSLAHILFVQDSKGIADIAYTITTVIVSFVILWYVKQNRGKYQPV